MFLRINIIIFSTSYLSLYNHSESRLLVMALLLLYSLNLAMFRAIADTMTVK